MSRPPATAVKSFNLVLSTSATLAGMAAGRITVADLDTAVFLMDGSRESFMDAENNRTLKSLRRTAGNPGGVDLAYTLLKAAVDNAEAHGRVMWLERGTPLTIGRLNAILQRNGLPEIECGDGLKASTVIDVGEIMGGNHTRSPLVVALREQRHPATILRNR